MSWAEQSKLKRMLIALAVTGICLIIPLFVMDNRPYDYKWHDIKILEQPIQLSHNTFIDLNGKKHSIAEFSGKPTILMFWATWCGICAHEFPKVDKFYENMGGAVNIIPVAVPDDTPQKIAGFYSKLGIHNLQPFIGKGKILHRKMGVRGVPSFFLLDEYGMAIAQMRPKWESSGLPEVLNKVLNGVEEKADEMETNQ